MTDKVENEEVLDSEKVDEKQDEKVEEGKEESTDEKSSSAVELSPLEQQAASYGWQPKEKWVESGNAEEDWVPAKHFMKFGELKQQTISKDKQLQKQERIIKMMKDHHLKVRETAYQDALKSIREERKMALEENDLVRAEALKDRIEELKEQHTKNAAVLPKEVEEEIRQAELEKQQQPPAPNPDFPVWHSKNPWYIVEVAKQDEISKEADVLANAIVEQARRDQRAITAKEVYEAVEKKIKKLYPEKFEPRRSPQSDSPNRTGAGGTKSTVKLTEDELAVAKAFGMTPEKYAEQQKSYKGR